MHRALNHYMPEQYVFDIPNNRTDLAAFAESLKEIRETAAGLVIEPLIQAAGGMKFHPPEMLAEIHRLCKEHRILFIADEIATGFGRTGSMFACLEAGITPDIMCLGKALTGGMVGLAATLATEEMFEAFLSDRLDTALMHGPTFMANPLTCAAANASLDLFEREPRIAQIQAIETQLREELKPCHKLENVADVRVKGAIGVVQLSDANGEYILTLRQRFIEEDVWLRPFSDVVYIMPAFTISPVELTQLTDAVFKTLAAK
jgi:adenosylmethionine-8-amino-7-oxononanoate aminotransferase